MSEAKKNKRFSEIAERIKLEVEDTPKMRPSESIANRRSTASNLNMYKGVSLPIVVEQFNEVPEQFI